MAQSGADFVQEFLRQQREAESKTAKKEPQGIQPITSDWDTLLEERGYRLPSMQPRESPPIDWRGLGAAGTSTAGSALMGALVARFPPLALAAPALQAASGYLTHKGNQALGLEHTPETYGGQIASDVASAAIPGVVQGVQTYAPALMRVLPGAAGAMHQQTAENLRALPGAIDIPTPSAPLFDMVESAGRGLPLTASETLAAARSVIQHEARAPMGGNAELVRKAQNLIDTITASGGTLGLDQAARQLRDAGKLSGVIQDKSGDVAGVGKKLFAAIAQDVDNQIATAGSGGTAAGLVQAGQLDTLKLARNAFRREAARDDLEALITKAIPPTQRADEAISVSPTQLAKFVRGDTPQGKFFRDSLTAPELQEIENTVKTALKLPKLPPPKGVNAGSYNLLARGAVGFALGGPQAAAILAAGPRIISSALMTPVGRKMLMRFASEGVPLTPSALTLLSGAIRAESQSPAPEEGQ